MIDWYTRLMLTVIAVALVVIALNPWITPREWLQAVGLRPPEGILAIPKTWGKVVGYSSGTVLLEAADGVLREVTLRPSGIAVETRSSRTE